LVCDRGNLNEIYNIGSGQSTTVSAIIELAKEYLGSTSNIQSKEAPEFHKIVQAKDFWMDTTKLKRLGFTQEISNEQIIRELCQ
jgi:nucleoside-diphosphate-sugar epimerase